MREGGRNGGAEDVTGAAVLLVPSAIFRSTQLPSRCQRDRGQTRRHGQKSGMISHNAPATRSCSLHHRNGSIPVQAMLVHRSRLAAQFVLRRVAPSSSRRGLATPTSTPASSSFPQTYIEKVVQKHAVDWPQGKAVRAGDFVTIRPAHVMTHDNTGPVISKCVPLVSSQA